MVWIELGGLFDLRERNKGGLVEGGGAYRANQVDAASRGCRRSTDQRKPAERRDTFQWMILWKFFLFYGYQKRSECIFHPAAIFRCVLLFFCKRCFE